MSDTSDETIQKLMQHSTDVLGSLLESLDQRRDIQEAIRQLMTPDDMLETFSQICVKDPDLARLTPQAAVAALVNTQSVMAMEAEIQRRAGLN